MPIRPLPDLLINQIAAGEVIERPASVVKELVENSLDAQASRIVVELEQGGIERITISDNGKGIPEEELPSAVAPHATSKISRAEDLDAISTLGFRGEALASIASVSRLTIRSRTPDNPSAFELHAEGETVGAVKPAAGPMGTNVDIRNLFFNTPARRKFLRTVSTEFGHCQQVVRTLAMSHPGVGFVIIHNGKTLLELAVSDSPRQRVIEILGKELENELLEVKVSPEHSGGLTLWGIIGKPNLARNISRVQHLFLNGRAIRDKSIQHALREAYRGLIEPGRYPTVALFLEMDPRLVDVNVHPAKAEVRFRDQSSVHGTILRAVKNALADADLTPAVSSGFSSTFTPNTSSQSELTPSTSNVPFFSPGSNALSPITNQQIYHPSPETPDAKERSDGAVQGVADSLQAFVEHFRSLDPKQKGLVYREVAAAMQEEDLSDIPEANQTPLPQPRRAESALQVHNSFIVTQDEQGLVIIDQHALHERLNFETLMERIRSGPLESQRLLMPEIINITPDQEPLLDSLSQLLKNIGIEAELIGPHAVAVHAFPTFLFERHVEIKPFMRELFDLAQSEGFIPGDEQALHEVIDMMSCKASIKAGDSLSEGEILELLKNKNLNARTSNCPHGRPTTIRITIRELEKQFGRR